MSVFNLSIIDLYEWEKIAKNNFDLLPSPLDIKVSMIIWAPLKKSPNCASHIIKWFGFWTLIPYSKAKTASSDNGLFAT